MLIFLIRFMWSNVFRIKPLSYMVLSFVLLSISLGSSAAYAESFNFIAMADSRGNNNGVNDVVLSRIVDLVSQENAQFIVFSGDLVSGSCTDIVLTSQLYHWRDVMNPIYNSTMYGAKVYAGPGNHDICNSGSESVWQSVFDDLPLDGPSGETYMTYSFDYLNSHFIMVDTNRTGNFHTINYNWLANDLASTSAEHIFVFGHEPAFPAGPHVGSSLDYYPSQRDAFWQLLSDYNVDIYFAGHEHLYNHVNVNGVHQVIAGTVGAPIYSGYGGDFYHYALITVDGSDVSVEIIDDSGAVRDGFYVCTNDPVRIYRTALQYPTIQNAYDTAIDGDIMQIQYGVFNEDLYIDRNISVTVESGYGCDYSVINSATILNGNMFVIDGIVTIESGTFELQ